MDAAPLQFPYVCADEEVCTRDKFMEWNIDVNISLPSFASRLQSWLFFGLVSIYLEEELPHEKVLTKDKNGRQYVDLMDPNSPLLVRLEESSSLFTGERDADHVPRRHLQVQKAISFAMVVIRTTVIPFLQYFNYKSVTDLWMSKSHAVIFGVDILIDILCEHVERYQSQSRSFLRTCRRRLSLPAEVPLISSSVRRSGRCSSLAGRLRPSSHEWYQIIHLPALATPQNHEDCTAFHCRRNDVVRDIYKPTHCDSCSGCFLSHTNHRIVCNAIRNSKIPLVSCIKDVKCGLRLKIVEGDLHSNYVAISHVWTGGLGNFDNNALPLCQLTRLWAMIRELPDLQLTNVRDASLGTEDALFGKIFRIIELAYGAIRSRRTVYFWIDTLCIPVAEEDLRKTAIATMAQIYAGAETVLVLDPDMQQLHLAPTHPSFMKLLTISPWMSRSWPLQEGAVAPSLCVRLKKETVLLSHAQHKELLSLSLHHTNSFSDYRAARNPTFAGVWNALASRGTTKSADLDGIFATLLNLDPRIILDIPEFERMKAIISTQKSVPFVLLCLPQDQNNAEQNLSQRSWMPNFPDTSKAMIRLDELHGVLHTELEGFLFRKSVDSGTIGLLVNQKHDFGEAFVLQDPKSDNLYKIHPEASPAGPPDQNSISTALFVLTFATFGSKPQYQGCWFEVLSQTEARMNVKRKGSFHWTYFSSESGKDDILEGELYEKLGDSSYQIVILEDFESGNMSTWHRSTAFPFTSIVDDEHELWMYATYPALIVTHLLGGAATILSIDLDLFDFWFLPWVGLRMCAWIIIRIAYTWFQQVLWRFWLAQWIRQRWAATFYISDVTQQLLEEKSPTLLFMIWTYAPLNTVAVVILACSWFYPGQGLPFTSASLTIFLEPVLSFSFMRMMQKKQELMNSGYKDAFPIRFQKAAILTSPGWMAIISLIIVDYTRGWWELTEGEIQILGYSIIYVIISIFCCLIWGTSLPGLAWSAYVARNDQVTREDEALVKKKTNSSN